MNIIEAMRAVLKDGWDMGSYQFAPCERRVTVQAAQLEMFAVIEAYIALAPKPEDWAQFPWAKWCTIDYQGRFFWECEPQVDGYRYWNRLEPKDGSDYGLWNCDYLAPKPDVRVGLDWRACKWMRPEEGKNKLMADGSWLFDGGVQP